MSGYGSLARHCAVCRVWPAASVVCVDPPCVGVCVSLLSLTVCDVVACVPRLQNTKIVLAPVARATLLGRLGLGSRTASRAGRQTGDKVKRESRSRGRGPGRLRFRVSFLEQNQNRTANVERATNDETIPERFKQTTTAQSRLNFTPRGAYTGYRVHGSSKTHRHYRASTGPVVTGMRAAGFPHAVPRASGQKWGKRRAAAGPHGHARAYCAPAPAVCVCVYVFRTGDES